MPIIAHLKFNDPAPDLDLPIIRPWTCSCMAEWVWTAIKRLMHL